MPPEIASHARAPRSGAAIVEFITAPRDDGAAWRHRRSCQFDLNRPAAPGDRALIFKAQSDTTNGGLKTGGRRFVPDEEIRDAQGVRIKRAA